jgi:flagellar hook-associated protein 2
LQGRPEDADVQYTSASSDTVAGDYALSVSALSTQGQFNGSVVNSLVINANNNSFTIKLDGVTSNSVNLTPATYNDGDALAAHIQAQINGDDQLKAEGATVSVVYDSVNNKFDITSAHYGSGSTIEFTSVDINSSDDIGFSVGSGTDGTDITGTINSVSATGNGQVLTSQTGNSNGLALNVSAGVIGNRGNVSFSRGLASTLDTLLSDFLDADGFIATREDGLKEGLEDIGRQRERLELRLESMEARFIKQFTALDILVARFNSTSNFLTQQLANLPKPNSVGNN